MTASTANGEAEEYTSRGGKDVVQLVQTVLFALWSLDIVLVGGAVPAETCPGQGFQVIRIGFITGNLFREEACVGLVGVEAPDYIVAIAPCVGSVEVIMEPRTVCIPGKVEPVASPSFTVSGTGQQFVQGSFIGIGTFISEELPDLFWGWRQTDDNEEWTAPEGCPE